MPYYTLGETIYADLLRRIAGASSSGSEAIRDLQPFVGKLVADERKRSAWYVDHAEKVLYIGKASFLSRVGNRLYTHGNRSLKAVWRDQARLVIFVIVGEPFEAPSPKEFFIGALQPPGNMIGGVLRRSSVACGELVHIDATLIGATLSWKRLSHAEYLIFIFKTSPRRDNTLGNDLSFIALRAGQRSGGARRTKLERCSTPPVSRRRLP